MLDNRVLLIQRNFRLNILRYVAYGSNMHVKSPIYKIEQRVICICQSTVPLLYTVNRTNYTQMRSVGLSKNDIIMRCFFSSGALESPNWGRASCYVLPRYWMRPPTHKNSSTVPPHHTTAAQSSTVDAHSSWQTDGHIQVEDCIVFGSVVPVQTL